MNQILRQSRKIGLYCPLGFASSVTREKKQLSKLEMAESEILAAFFFGFIYLYYCYVLSGGWPWGEITSLDYVSAHEPAKIRT